ncbi:MAG: hypothetical protein GY895_21770 [Phycisphaera sp.]|nr:hypothetical protein [Phycisphaera sp.]
MSRLLDQPRRPRCSIPRDLVALALISTSTSAFAAPQAPPATAPAAVEPLQLRRIADADGRPVDDAPVVVQAAGERIDFDPLEVRRVDLRVVEATIGDQGALDLSLRQVPQGLRLPTGYDQVFAGNTGGFWRADGGLVARFNQSIYMATKYGPIPDIPASTVFIIGGVPMGGEPGHGRLLAVDPLAPGLVPPLLAPTAVPDEWHSPSAVPGDRLERFGFGPGFRVPARADADADVGTGLARFQEDGEYRAGRIGRLIAYWRAAGRSAAADVPPVVSPLDSDSEEARSTPPDATASHDPRP